MTKENNHMLRAMRRSAMIGGILKFVFWIFIFFVIPYFLWQYLQPYLEEVSKMYQQIHGSAASAQASSDSLFAEAQKFFSQFGSGGAK